MRHHECRHCDSYHVRGRHSFHCPFNPSQFEKPMANTPSTPPPATEALPDAEALALGKAVQLITEAHAQYSKSGMARPFFEFVRIVLTAKEER